jgi:hypothetical protein
VLFRHQQYDLVVHQPSHYEILDLLPAFVGSNRSSSHNQNAKDDGTAIFRRARELWSERR